MERLDDWRTRVILIGAVVGLLTGLGTAYMLIQRSEQSNVRPELSAGDGVKLGLGVLGLMRLVSDFGER